VKYHDRPSGKTFNFLTNNFAVPAQTLADLYRVVVIFEVIG